MGNEVNLQNIKQDGYINILKYRGEKKASGISYDYMDKLNTFVKAGIFIDAKKDGYTDSEKQALEKELFNIHQERGYSTNFTQMLPGTKTEYSYEEFIRLAEAAGYVLKEQPSSSGAKNKQLKRALDLQEGTSTVNLSLDKKPDALSKKAKNDVTLAAKSTQAEVKFPDKLSDKAANDSTLSIPHSINTETTTVSKEVKPDKLSPKANKDTNLKKSVGEAGQSKDTTKKSTAEQVLIDSINADPELANKKPEEKVKILNKRKSDLVSKKYDLEQTHETYQKKNFWGVKKTKTREYTPEEKAERSKELASVKVELDKLEKHKVYVERVQANKYWGQKYSSQSLENDKGEVLADYPSYYQEVVLVNGKEQKAARVDNYNPKTLKTDSKYYSVDVQKVGSPKYLGGPYYSVVPDMNNELTNVKTK